MLQQTTRHTVTCALHNSQISRNMQAASAVARATVRPLNAVNHVRQYIKPGMVPQPTMHALAALQGGSARPRHVATHAAATDASEETFTYQAEVCGWSIQYVGMAYQRAWLQIQPSCVSTPTNSCPSHVLLSTPSCARYPHMMCNPLTLNPPPSTNTRWTVSWT